ncbi:SDR family NAD(P)-dependent oxidoreductase [Nocardia sp. 2]|uniref:SDR family NAD(P)-dependent oxidoreductase n=1 Tax=Nocardia acididurans TaxID=2802282 RepID=A0ABS1MAD2_9NOCA|nr:SDR family NAD(P)-dependent oxidoreductase [Nocardia acididurans]MBL1077519.1 SDR family NAD(P)-dependent oxidoreductase [Nocardia acididurans]
MTGLVQPDDSIAVIGRADRPADGPEGFDAEFFGISAEDAAAMDRRHWSMLEMSWEAVEVAGIDPMELRGGDIGVFLGAAGGGHSVIARALDLRGPALSIDTEAAAPAAVDLAVRALAAGECSLALVGAESSMLLLERLPDAHRNGHRVLELVHGAAVPPAPPITLAAPGQRVPLVVWPISGKTPEALTAQAARLADHVRAHPEFSGREVGHALTTTRSTFDHRAVVLGRNRVELLAALDAMAEGRPDGPTRGHATSGRRIMFVFPGQGQQYAGMAAQLLRESPVFAAKIAEVDAALSEFVDWSLIDVLNEADGAPTLERVDVVQPALFATMISLAALWNSLGIEPAAVLGHSQGEVAAAYVAGALTLRDAVRIVALRSKLLRELDGTGGMASINAPVARVRALMADIDDLYIAAVNSPGTTVVAGGISGLSRILASCARETLRARKVPASCAGHTPHVDVLRERLDAAVAPITARTADLRFFSTVTGSELDSRELGPDYWFRNLREPVRFEEGFRAAAEAGFDAFLEMSATPVLTAAMFESLGDAADSAVVVGSLKRDDAGIRRLLTSVSEAHVRGVTPDWAAIYPVGSANPITLPTYAFQRRVYTPSGVSGARGDEPGGLGLVTAGHPLLGAVVERPGGDGFQFLTGVSVETHSWLADYTVHGTAVLPAAALLELALHVGDRLGVPRVAKLTVHSPVAVPADGAVDLQVVVGEFQDAARTVAVYSRPTGSGAPLGRSRWMLHADGVLTPPETAAADTHGLSVWPPVGAEPVPEPGLVYEDLAELGFRHGPAFRGMKALWRRGADIFAEVAVPGVVADAERYGLHPALLDAAVQPVGAAATPLPSAPDSVRMPIAWENVELRVTGARAARVRLTSGSADHSNWALADAAGQIIATGAVRVGEVSLRDSAAHADSGMRESLYDVGWSAVQAWRRRYCAGPGEWVIVGDQPSGVRDSAGLMTYPDLDSLYSAADSGAAVPKVVLLSRCAAARAEPGAEPVGRVRDELAAMLALGRTWLATERFADTKLVILTTGVHAVEPTDDVSDLIGPAVWAMVRSAQAEYRDRILQLDIDGAGISLDQLTSALRLDEPELALRQGQFFARRIRSGVDGTDGAPLTGPWRLVFPASTDNTAAPLVDLDVSTTPGVHPLPDAEPAFHTVATPLGAERALGAEPAPGAVLVALRAAGTSVAVGAMDSGSSRMFEAAGIVVAAGPDSGEFTRGDRVFGLVDEIAATVTADHRLLARVPADWSFAEAAAAPVAYLTALRALRESAAAQPGETVLVHAATGAVGTAAVNLARHLGLEVFATASKSKWDVLRRRGLREDRIADSRSADFVKRFTSERGIDVVLNLLPDTFTRDSLGLLSSTGRFVEIARDVVHDADAVRAEYGVSYSSFELGALTPDALGDSLSELSALFADGALAPLPLTRFDVRQACAALRCRTEGRHIGRVVLTWPSAFDPERTVLITGGTGVIGGIIARHLVAEYGARHLLLTSRSGPTAAGIEELTAELSAAGAEVTVAACDASDRDALAAVIAEVPAAHPIGAVIHLAAVLSDATFATLTEAQLDTVLRAKVDGAWHLHELTRHLDLSMFVLFSSASGALGVAGQANYGAANVFLDSLARLRHRRGLPATAMAWGLWAQDTSNTGYLDDNRRARIGRMGLTPMPTADALELFDAGLRTGEPYVVPIGLDLAQLRAGGPNDELPPFFHELPDARPQVTSQVDEPAELVRRLAGLDPGAQHEAVIELFKTPVAIVLGYAAPDAVDPDREFARMGLDSLGSIELGARLRALTGVRLGNAVIFQHPTVRLLARHVLDQIAPRAAELADPIIAEVELLLDRLVAVHGGEPVPEELVARLNGSLARLREATA